jgi:hypothetical protein
MVNHSLLVFSIILLAGCASTPTNPNVNNKDVACIETESSNIYNFYVNGGAKVEIKEIDDAESSNSMMSQENRFCFAAGEHKIGVTASTSGESVNEYISYPFEANKKYKLSAKLKGIAFHLSLSDVTNTPEVLMKEFKVKISGAGSSSTPLLT